MFISHIHINHAINNFIFINVEFSIKHFFKKIPVTQNNFMSFQVIEMYPEISDKPCWLAN